MKKLFTRKRVMILAGLLLFALMSYISWQYWTSERQLSKVRQLTDDLASEATKNLPDDQKMDKFVQVMQEAQKLTPDQQMSLFMDRMKEQAKRDDEKFKKFFAASKKEQLALLDDEINQQENRRKQREAEQAKLAAANGNKGSGGFLGGMPGIGWVSNNNQAKSGAAPAQSGMGMWGNIRPEQIEQMRKLMANIQPGQIEQFRKASLDVFTPEQRAQRAEYSQQMSGRRQQRGLPAQNMGPWR